MRAIACTMVIVCHISVYAGDGALVGLKNGVMLFFVLSGYLLYSPFVRETVDLRRYAIHRAGRVLPAYLLALGGVTILTGDQTFVRQPFTYLLFAQNYDPRLWQGFVGVSWTLVVEVWFYLTLPILAHLIGGSPARLGAIALASLSAAFLSLVLFPSIDARMTSSFWPMMIWCFTPGMLVALLEPRLGWMRHVAVLAAGVVLLVIGTAMWWASVDVVSAAGAALVVGWTIKRKPSLGIAAPVASAGAALTYAAYLWHVDLIRGFGMPLGPLAAVAVAAASYALIERPVLRVLTGQAQSRKQTPQRRGRSWLPLRRRTSECQVPAKVAPPFA